MGRDKDAVQLPNKQLTGNLLPPVRGSMVIEVTSWGDGALPRGGAEGGAGGAQGGRKTVDSGSAWAEAVQSACSSCRR